MRVTHGAMIDAVARAMVADLHAQPDEVQAAFRYLNARVALDEGLLELIAHENNPEGERLICQEPDTGRFSVVDRRGSWTAAEGAEYVAELRRCRLGSLPG